MEGIVIHITKTEIWEKITYAHESERAGGQKTEKSDRNKKKKEHEGIQNNKSEVRIIHTREHCGLNMKTTCTGRAKIKLLKKWETVETRRKGTETSHNKDSYTKNVHTWEQAGELTEHKDNLYKKVDKSYKSTLMHSSVYVSWQNVVFRCLLWQWINSWRSRSRRRGRQRRRERIEFALWSF